MKTNSQIHFPRFLGKRILLVHKSVHKEQWETSQSDSANNNFQHVPSLCCYAIAKGYPCSKETFPLTACFFNTCVLGNPVVK